MQDLKGKRVLFIGIGFYDYDEHIVTKMQDLGYEPVVNAIDDASIKRMKWFDSLSAGKQHTDFFANRVTNYSKGVQIWDANDLF